MLCCFFLSFVFLHHVIKPKIHVVVLRVVLRVEKKSCNGNQVKSKTPQLSGPIKPSNHPQESYREELDTLGISHLSSLPTTGVQCSSRSPFSPAETVSDWSKNFGAKKMGA
jgi:hypothetical protein